MTLACPHCRKVHDSATCVTDDRRAPEEGDAGLCVNCGMWLIYTKEGGARAPSARETAEIARDPMATRCQQAWIQINRPRGRPQ